MKLSLFLFLSLAQIHWGLAQNTFTVFNTVFNATTTVTSTVVPTCYQLQAANSLTSNFDSITTCGPSGYIPNPAAMIRDAYILERLRYGPGGFMRFREQQNMYRDRLINRVGRSALVDEEPVLTEELISPTRNSDMPIEVLDDELDGGQSRNARIFFDFFQFKEIVNVTETLTVSATITATTTNIIPLLGCTPAGQTNFCSSSINVVPLAECSSNTQCTDTTMPACVDGNCVECSVNMNCDMGMVCNTDTNTCVACLVNDDCTVTAPTAGGTNTKVCNTATNECVDCLDNTNCADQSAPVCDTSMDPPVCAACADNACILGQTCMNDACACASNDNCPTGEVCVAMSCVPACDASTNPCTAMGTTSGGNTQVCNTVTGLCVDCLSSATDCNDGTLVNCDAATNTCIA